MKIKNNNDGSSLVLTVILIAVLSIMLVGFSTAIVSYASRINSTYYENQAYLSARSVVTAIAEEIEAISAEELGDIEADGTSVKGEITDPLLLAMDQMVDGESLDLTGISFDSGNFIEGDTTASISKDIVTDGGTTTTIYTITGTSDVNGYTDTVALELASITNTLTYEWEEEVTVTTGSGSSGSSNSVSFYNDTTSNFFYCNGNITLDTVFFEKNKVPDIVTSGTVTITGKVKLEEENSIYAETIIFDLTDKETLDMLCDFYAEEICIVEGTSEDSKIENAFDLKKDKSTLYTSKISEYLNTTWQVTYNNPTSYKSKDGDVTVKSLTNDNYYSYMNTANSLSTVSWPSSYPTTVAAAKTAGATSLSSGTQTLTAGKLYHVSPSSSSQETTISSSTNPTASNPIYIIVQSGKTLTLKGLDSEYFYIYLEDGATLKINEDEPTCTVYYGGEDSEVIWMVGDSNDSGYSGTPVTTTTGTYTETTTTEIITHTEYYDYTSYGLSQYVRE